MKIFFVGLLLIHSASAQYYARLLDFKDIIQKKKEATVKIEISSLYINGHGTGLFYEKEGYIFTNHHVVKEFVDQFDSRGRVVKKFKGGPLKIKITGQNHDYKNISLIHCSDDKGIDLCLFKIQRPKSDKEFFPNFEAKPNVGMEVGTIGHCNGDWVHKRQRIVKIHRDLNAYLTSKSQPGVSYASGNIPFETIEIDGHGICPGDSGGPVFGSNGELIGVSTFGVGIFQNNRFTDKLDVILSAKEVHRYYKQFFDRSPVTIPQELIGETRYQLAPLPRPLKESTQKILDEADSIMQDCLLVKKDLCISRKRVFCGLHGKTLCDALNGWVHESLDRSGLIRKN